MNLREEYDRLFEALTIIEAYNGLNNDRDVYLFEVTRWAFGDREDKPNPEDYGL